MKNWILKHLFPHAATALARESAAQWRAKKAEEEVSFLSAQTKSLTKDCQRLAAENQVQRQRRNVGWTRPATRIPRAKVLQEFNVPLDRGFAAALHQELDDAIQEVLDVVSQPPSSTLTEQHRLHLAGGIEHLRSFQKQLLDLAAKASTGDPELEDDEKAKPAA